MTRRTTTVLWVTTCGYALLLVAVSLLPSGIGPLSGWDAAVGPALQNLLHVPAYGLLVGLTAGVAGLSRLRHLALAAACCAAFGGLLECAQAAIPGRLGSLDDVLLNAVGSAAGAGAVFGLRKLTRHNAVHCDQETATPVSGETR